VVEVKEVDQPIGARRRARTKDRAMQVLTDSYAGMDGFSAVEVDELFMVGGGSSMSVSIPGGSVTISYDNGTYTATTYNQGGEATSISKQYTASNSGLTLNLTAGSGSREYVYSIDGVSIHVFGTF